MHDRLVHVLDDAVVVTIDMQIDVGKRRCTPARESLFAIWKYVHGLAVYNDRYQPPYNAAMYNWLFYESYGFFQNP